MLQFTVWTAWTATREHWSAATNYGTPEWKESNCMNAEKANYTKPLAGNEPFHLFNL